MSPRESGESAFEHEHENEHEGQIKDTHSSPSRKPPIVQQVAGIDLGGRNLSMSVRRVGLLRGLPVPLYAPALSTFEDDAGSYRQSDATGFIRLQELHLRRRGL
jgi:hypothetical protein